MVTIKKYTSILIVCLLIAVSLVPCRISLSTTKDKDLPAKEAISFPEDEDINLLLLSDKYSSADLLAKDLQDEFGITPDFMDNIHVEIRTGIKKPARNTGIAL